MGIPKNRVPPPGVLSRLEAGWSDPKATERKPADSSQAPSAALSRAAASEASAARLPLPLEGDARGVQPLMNPNAGNSQGQITLIEFRLQRYDENGNPQVPIPVAIRWPRPGSSCLSEGDRVKIVSGKWRRTGILKATQIQNLTTGILVKTRFSFFKYSWIILLLGFMAAVPLAVLAPPLALVALVLSFVVFVISNVMAVIIRGIRISSGS
jgi:hypothetical protein